MPVTYNRTNKATPRAVRYLEGRGKREADARARRDDAQKQNIDAALRQPLQQTPMSGVVAEPAVPEPTNVVPPTTSPPVAPAAVPRSNNVAEQQVNNLANVPGGAAMAGKIRANQQNASAKAEEQIWELIQKGENENNPGYIDQARYLNQQTSAGIPDYFFDDPQIRSQLTQVIAAARKHSKDPRQIAAFIQSALSQNTDLLSRISRSERSGRGIPEGIQAGANVAKGQEKDKNRNIRARARGPQDKYPEKRIRLELLKQYKKLTTTTLLGDKIPLYPNEYLLNKAVNESMSSFGYPQDSQVKMYNPAIGKFE